MNFKEYFKKFEKPGEQQRCELGYTFHLKRRLSFYLSIPFVHAPISPNQITVLANVVQIVGSGCIAFGEGYQRLFGILLFYGGDLLDFIDGNIARFRNQSSLAGVQLDQLGHVVVAPLFFAAIGIAALHDTNQLLFAYLTALLAAGPAIVSYQLVALGQFFGEARQAAPAIENEKSKSPLRRVIRKLVSSVFHFKTEIVLAGILFDRIPEVAVLFASYFPLRIALQGILDFRSIRAGAAG